MKVWIDLANSPHALMFAPVARGLAERGAEVLVTARDNAQTVALARERWPDAVVIGEPSPPGRARKALAVAGRAAALARWAARRRPDVVLCHNSHAQVVAARGLRIPVVTGSDFEHQPANNLAFRLARTILAPEVVPGEALRRQGATPRKLRRYPGLKEELYLGEFEPDPGLPERLGAPAGEGRVVVVARTPPSRAVYHPFDNPLFEAALRELGRREDVTAIVLARYPEQRDALAALGLPNLIVPRDAVDSRALMHAADAVLGAGGTMTREAALLGVPTWSLYAGAVPAVDRWLEREGLLRRLEAAEELRELGPRTAPARPPAELRARGRAIEDAFVSAVLEAGGG